VSLDDRENRTGSALISVPGAGCEVLVVETDEERVIAGHVTELLVAGRGPASV
jgi:acetate kinase